MTPTKMTLIRAQERPTENATTLPRTGEAARRTQPQVNLAPGKLVLGGGGFGTATCFKFGALQLLRGDTTIPSIITLDNTGSVPAWLDMPDGRTLTFPLPHARHLYLIPEPEQPDRRTLLRRFPLLVRRYEESGLLLGHTVARTTGNGGGSVPLMSMIDIELMIGKVRPYFRAALLRATLQQRGQQRGVLRDVDERQRARARRLDVVIVVGGTGSQGNAMAVLGGPLLRYEASQIPDMPTPRVWLVFAGPSAFEGYTMRTRLNYAATLETLRYQANFGTHHEFIDGTVIDEAEPPYERILLVDDATLGLNGERVDDTDNERFGWRTAALIDQILSPEVRAAYLDEVNNPNANVDRGWPGFILAQLSAGGFSHDLLRERLAAALAFRRAATLRSAIDAAGPIQAI